MIESVVVLFHNHLRIICISLRNSMGNGLIPEKKKIQFHATNYHSQQIGIRSNSNIT